MEKSEPKNSKILLIEDDGDIREGIGIILRGEGYKVVGAANGKDGLGLLDSDVDLIILDIMMPGMSGIRVCNKIRESSNVPILFLTAKSTEKDKNVGFMAGGDDYMTKPFSYSELLARVKALIRRYQVYKGKGDLPESMDYIEKKGIRISRSENEATVNGKPVSLSDIEYGMLILMMSEPGKVFSAETIYETVWHEPYYYSSNSTVMVHIRKLRMKIEKNPQEPVLIKTIWGKGYRFG